MSHLVSRPDTSEALQTVKRREAIMYGKVKTTTQVNQPSNSPQAQVGQCLTLVLPQFFMSMLFVNNSNNSILKWLQFRYNRGEPTKLLLMFY